MAARIYTQHAERKLPMAGSSKPAKAGAKPGVTVKAKNWGGLPGKVSNGFAKMRGPKVYQHPVSKGLC